MKRLARRAVWVLAALLFGGWGLARRALRGRRPPPDLKKVRAILAIRLDLMGDLVFTLPAVDALRKAAPGARISLLVLPYTAELLRGLPSVDRVISVDVNRWRRPGEWLRGAAWRELWQAMAQLRAEPWDLCISFYGRVGAAAALLSGARYLAGYREDGYAATFDLPVEGRRYRTRQHETEYCLDLVVAVGASTVRGLVAPPVDPSAAERVAALLKSEGVGPEARLVVLHPGALNMAAKRWLPERWAAVADRVQMELPLRVVLVGSAAEMPLAREVRGMMRTAPLVLAGRTSVAELVALLRRCDLFLGGDSGPLHVASALGIPSVSVYGPTDPAITGPLGPGARVVRGAVECSPCYDPGGVPCCRRGDLACMAGVSVEQVFEAAREALTPTLSQGERETRRRGEGDEATGRGRRGDGERETRRRGEGDEATRRGRRGDEERETRRRREGDGDEGTGRRGDGERGRFPLPSGEGKGEGRAGE